MRLTIDISEQMYLNAKADTLCGADILVSAIKNGTPLDKVLEDIYTEACKRTCRLSEFANQEVLDYFNNEIYKHREDMTLADKLNNLCCNYHCRVKGIVSCYPNNFPPFRPQQDGDDVIFVNNAK